METQHGSEISASPDLMAGYQHQTDDGTHNEVPAEVASETAYAEPHSAEAGSRTSLACGGKRTDHICRGSGSFARRFFPASGAAPTQQHPAPAGLAGRACTGRFKNAGAGNRARGRRRLRPNVEIEIPTAPAAMPAIAASAGRLCNRCRSCLKRSCDDRSFDEL